MQHYSRKFYTLLTLGLILSLLSLLLDGTLYYAGVIKPFALSDNILFTRTGLSVLSFLFFFGVSYIYLLKKKSIAPYDLLVKSFKWFIAFGMLIILIWVAPGSLSYYSEFIEGKAYEFPTTITTVASSHVVTILIGFCIFSLINLRLVTLSFERTKLKQLWFIICLLGTIVFSLCFSKSSYIDFLEQFFFVGGSAVVVSFFPLFSGFGWTLEMGDSEKKKSVLLILFLCLALIAMMANKNSYKQMMTYSYSVAVGLYFISGYVALYFFIAAIVIGFQIPSSSTLNKKRSEVKNLQAMNRLIVSVFDKEKIYDSLIQYACKAVGNHSQGLIVNNDIKKFKIISSSENFQKMPLIPLEDIKSFIEKNISVQRTLINTVPKPIARSKNTFLNSKLLDFLSESIQCLVLPIRFHGTTYGKLVVMVESYRGFYSSTVELIETFSEQSAAALYNESEIQHRLQKQRMDHELKLAQRIQQQLLPKEHPRIGQFEIDAISFPAYEVGGDYYDYKLRKNDELSFIIADVSGKSLPASFYMTELKGIFNTLAVSEESTPKNFLIQANEAILDNLSPQTFISASYGILDSSNQVLKVANAGHLPFIHVRDGKISFVGKSSPAIGLFRGERKPDFENHIFEETIQLKYEDILVFYTDGVTESFKQKSNEYFGRKQLSRVILSCYKDSAEKIVKSIADSVSVFSRDTDINKQDDLTVIVIKVLKV